MRYPTQFDDDDALGVVCGKVRARSCQPQGGNDPDKRKVRLSQHRPLRGQKSMKTWVSTHVASNI
jgi:hypothetical protein